MGGATKRYRNTNASNHRDPGAAKPQPHDCTNERWAPKFRLAQLLCPLSVRKIRTPRRFWTLVEQRSRREFQEGPSEASIPIQPRLIPRINVADVNLILLGRVSLLRILLSVISGHPKGRSVVPGSSCLPESSPRLSAPAQPCGRGRLAQFRLPQRFAVWWVALPWPILPVPAVLLALCRVVAKKESKRRFERNRSAVGKTANSLVSPRPQQLTPSPAGARLDPCLEPRRSAVRISAWATGPPAGVGGGLGPFRAA